MVELQNNSEDAIIVDNEYDIAIVITVSKIEILILDIIDNTNIFDEN